jgi:hypothetical protein
MARDVVRNLLFLTSRFRICAWRSWISSRLGPIGLAIYEDSSHFIFKTTRFTLKIAKNTGECDMLRIDGACENFISSTTDLKKFILITPLPGPLTTVSLVSTSSTSGTLVFDYGASSGSVQIRVNCTVYARHIAFELGEAVPGQVQHVYLANVQINGQDSNLQTGTVISDVYRISEFALSLPTQITVRQAPDSLDYSLLASWDRSLGLSGLSVAFFACSDADWLTTAGEVEKTHNLPHPLIEGAWVKTHPDRLTSYLFVDLKPGDPSGNPAGNEDFILECAQKGGFKYILVRVNAWADTLGNYYLKETYCKGNLARIVDRIHHTPIDPAHPDGPKMKFGLHVLTGVISAGSDTQFKRDPYFCEGELGPSVSVDCEDESNPTWPFDCEDESDPTWPFDCEDESYPIVHFEGCKYFPNISLDAGKALLANIAENFARRVYCPSNADMVFLDTVAGFSLFNDRTRLDPLPPWYTYSFVVNTYWEQLNRVWHSTRVLALTELNALLHSAACSQNYEWHALARATSQDYAVIGVEAYMDHIKLGHRDKITNAHLVQDLGWIGLSAKTGQKTENSYTSTTTDQLEYQLNRSLGYKLPIGLETTEDQLQINGSTDNILARIKLYEEARLSGAIPAGWVNRLIGIDEVTLGYLRDYGEFYGLRKIDHQLSRTPTGYSLKRRLFYQHLVTGSEDEWEFFNPFPEQPFQIKIQALPGLAPNYGPKQLTLINGDFHLDDLRNRSSEIEIIRFDLDDLEQTLTLEIQNNPGGTHMRWVELWQGVSEDLRDYKYLSLDIQGANRGEYVSIMLQDSAGAYRQYQFKVDSSTMQHKNLFLPATDELFTIPQPDSYDRKSAEILKNSFRPFQYGDVTRVTIWIKNIPPPASTAEILTFRFKSVMALKQDYTPLVDPSIGLNGSLPIKFAVPLHPELLPGIHNKWEYLVYHGGKKYTVYDGNNSNECELEPVFIGPAVPPKIRGNNLNHVHFKNSGSAKALVTIIVEDRPILS